MAVFENPNEKNCDENGIIAIGKNMTQANLFEAYSKGIFPWPIEDIPLCWFCPDPRAILEFKNLRIDSRLSRYRKNSLLTFAFNQNFAEVIKRCALTKRPGQKGTWITPELFQAYVEFHKAGFAHSCEAYEDGKLVAGVYGVFVKGVFSAESMFTTKSNASKLTLLHLIDHLRSIGCEWIDIQMLTPHLEKLGAHELPRTEFLALLKAPRTIDKSPFFEN